MSLNQEDFARCQRSMHGPSWRARSAAQMRIRVGTRTAEAADDVLCDFNKYQRLKARSGPSGTHAAARYPTIAAAELLNEDSEKTAALKLMVVADMAYDEMQTRSGIEVSVLRMWESLFFDVRNQRQATGWLAYQVVEPEVKAGNPELALKLKVAIMTGPVAVRAMLDMQQGICLDEADRLFQRRIRLSEKLDLCVNMPIDSDRAKMFFMKMHLGLMEAEQRQALAERKLSQRGAEARDAFELAKLRIEQATEFHAAKRSEKMRDTERRMNDEELRRRAARELEGYQAQAQRRMVQTRIEESPLSFLRWNSEPAATFERGSPDASTNATIVNIVEYRTTREVVTDINQAETDAAVSEPKQEHLLAAI